MEYNTIADQLIERIPEFERTYKRNIDEYGEILLHALFGDLVRFTIDIYRSTVEGTTDYHDPQEVFRRIMDFIEDAANAEDHPVVELVTVSYLESLWRAGPYYERIVSQLGPSSRKLLQESDQFWKDVEDWKARQDST